MKNIFTVPSSNPSHIHFNKEDNKLMLVDDLPVDGKSWEPAHVYITTSETITEPGWCLSVPFKNEVFKAIEVTKCRSVRRARLHLYPEGWCEEIILTTDPVLIKDGIQKLDDTFVEKLIANPVHFAEVDQVSLRTLAIEWWGSLSTEETSDIERLNGIYGHDQGTTEMEVVDFFIAERGLDKNTHHYNTVMHEVHLEESNHILTIDDAAKNWVFDINGHKWSSNDDTAGDNYGSFKAGAQWNESKMYSAEELRSIIKKYSAERTDEDWESSDDEWLSKFKK